VNSEEVLFRKEGGVAYVTIKREEALNALKWSVMQRVDELFAELEHDDEVVVVVITGAGQKSFVAGADVKEIQDAGEGRTALITKGQKIFCKIRNSSKIVLAAINGYALGGGLELAQRARGVGKLLPLLPQSLQTAGGAHHPQHLLDFNEYVGQDNRGGDMLRERGGAEDEREHPGPDDLEDEAAGAGDEEAEQGHHAHGEGILADKLGG